MFGVATSTMTDMFEGLFGTAVSTLIYVLTYSFPYILAIAFIWFLYRLVRGVWK